MGQHNRHSEEIEKEKEIERNGIKSNISVRKHQNNGEQHDVCM